MCVTWDGKQSSFWVFSFSSHKKFIFLFSSVKTGFFREATTKYMMFNWTKIFLYARPMRWGRLVGLMEPVRWGYTVK
jgi:hypothetical protein